VTELAGREAYYRQRLGEQHRLNERLRACSEALRRVLRERPPRENNLLDTLHAAALLTGRSLDIGRTSVWLMDKEHAHLRCRVLLMDGIEQPCDELVLPAVDCPNYLRALTQDDPLAVADTLNDPRTTELLDYLRSHDVGALLDIAVLAQGELLGVVCLEHVGGVREWWPPEIAFASHLGSLVALGVEAERRTRAEFAAREAEARYRHLVESLPVTVYSMDVEKQRLRYVSPQVSQLGGITVEQALAMGPEVWFRRIVDDDRHLVLDRFRKDQPHSFPDELVYRVNLGGPQVRWIRDTCSLVRDADGNPMVLQGIIAEITAQREAELAHEENERRARTLVQNMALVALRIDTHGCIADVNPCFCEVLGYAPDEVLGKSWYDFLASKDDAARLRTSYQAALRVGSIVPRAEYAVRTKSGEVRRFSWTRTVVKDTAGKSEGLVTFGMDLTDRLRLEAELLQQAKVESLGHLASAVAHDFNNLLTVILNQTAMLARMAPDGKAERITASLDQALSQATELTQSLLVYSRKNPEQKELTDVDELLRELHPLLQAMAGHALRVVENLRAEGGLVWIDRMRLRQVVLNLVGNAAQATQTTGTNIRVGTHLAFVDGAWAHRKRGIHAHGSATDQTEGGECVVITVEDDGCGMDPATLTKIFEPFFTTKNEGHGTGLGLAICQSIVQEAGGFIEVSSEVGRGTSVAIYFARRAADALPVSEGAPSGVVRPPRVLFLLDHSAPAAWARATREAGYTVLIAQDPKDGIDKLSDGPVELLVLDSLLGPPVIALAHTARVVHPGIHVILLEHEASPPLVVSGSVRLPRNVEPDALVDALDSARLDTPELRRHSAT
jgi:PAS domain S-box-containing protein